MRLIPSDCCRRSGAEEPPDEVVLPWRLVTRYAPDDSTTSLASTRDADILLTLPDDRIERYRIHLRDPISDNVADVRHVTLTDTRGTIIRAIRKSGRLQPTAYKPWPIFPLRREVEVMKAMLRSPHRAKFVQLLGVLDDTSAGRGFSIFSAPIAGMDLADWMLDDKECQDAVLFDIYRQSLAGLAAWHSLGAVHRDFKAENIMITTSDHRQVHVTLIDAGNAILDGSVHGFSSCVLPSIPTRSPEERTACARGDFDWYQNSLSAGYTVDELRRSDCFAAGALLLRLFNLRLQKMRYWSQAQRSFVNFVPREYAVFCQDQYRRFPNKHPVNVDIDSATIQDELVCFLGLYHHNWPHGGLSHWIVHFLWHMLEHDPKQRWSSVDALEYWSLMYAADHGMLAGLDTLQAGVDMRTSRFRLTGYHASDGQTVHGYSLNPNALRADADALVQQIHHWRPWSLLFQPPSATPQLPWRLNQGVYIATAASGFYPPPGYAPASASPVASSSQHAASPVSPTQHTFAASAASRPAPAANWVNRYGHYFPPNAAALIQRPLGPPSAPRSPTSSARSAPI